MADPLLPEQGQQLDLKKIEKELTKANPSLFKGVPDPKKKEILSVFAAVSLQITSHHHTSPLPSPQDLAAYNAIIPNGADRIMRMAENQQPHRFFLEKKAVGRQTFQSQLGQIFGLIIGLAAIGSGTYCILQSHDWAGGFLGGGGLTGLVSVFVLGKKSQSKSLREKNN